MLLTVFTPTYNRIEKIKDLYNSLLQQTCFDFEWVVVDDGSKDNTDCLFEDLKKSTDKFDIVYFKQKNHGKHSAINKGVELAKGEAFVIVDSDDYLCRTAVENILKCLSTIKDKSGFCGCAGLKIYADGKTIGKKGNTEVVDCTSLERNKYDIIGDKAEVFYTQILKKYPFPVFEGENFLTEKVVWYRIAKDGYKIRWTNEPYITCEYLPGGLTNNHSKFKNNYYGLCLTAKEMRKYKCLGLRERYFPLINASVLYKNKGLSIKEFSKLVDCNYFIIIAANITGKLIKFIKKITRGHKK